MCALGDLILTVPWFRTLMRMLKADDIHLVCHHSHGELLKWAGLIRKAFTPENSGWHLLYGPTCPRVWPDLSPDPTTYENLYLFSAQTINGPIPFLRKKMGDRLHVIPPRPPKGYTLHASTVPFVSCGLEWNMKEIQELVLLKEPKPELGFTKDRLVLGIHPGSGSKAKNWPTESFASLLRLTWSELRGLHFIVLKGPGDEREVRDLSKVLNIPHQVLEPPDLISLASILEGIDLYIGNDSGVTHLASSLGVRTVAIFGPSDPTMWSPLGPNVKVVTREDACSPCHLSDKTPCPSPCQRFPSVEEVWNSIEGLVSFH